MISRNLYMNIIIRVLAIAALSVLLGYVIFSARSVRLSIICILAIIIVTSGLVSYLNRS